MAIELSTDIGSLALLKDETVVVEEQWTEDRRRRQLFFQALANVVRSGRVDLPRIDTFAVGLGPGTFAGLRAAVSAVRALALPGGRTVFGVSSSEALAWDVFQEMAADRVAVVGDARRNQLWVAVFQRQANWPLTMTPWLLTDCDRMTVDLPAGPKAWVSPDWDRVGQRIRAFCARGDTMVETKRAPRARAVGLLAVRKIKAGVAGEPLAPIYVHPAVSVAPRF